MSRAASEPSRRERDLRSRIADLERALPELPAASLVALREAVSSLVERDSFSLTDVALELDRAVERPQPRGRGQAERAASSV